MTEYLQRRIKEDTLTSLLEAVRLAPTNALASAHLARRLVNQDAKDNPRRVGEADFFSRRAVELAPDDLEVLRIRAEVTERIGKMGKPEEK